jgi:hypothetical protein
MCYVVLQTVISMVAVVMLTVRGHAVIEYVDGRVCAYRVRTYDGTDNQHNLKDDASTCASISVLSDD